MNDEKRTRKLYGEKMWHLCRSLFPTILETPGLLSKLLEEHFNPTRYLYEDIVDNNLEDEFKDYIYDYIYVDDYNRVITNKTVRELLDEAGYDFYECHSEEDIQSFKKYYSKGEELCTFNGGRLNRCYVFFAVKKNVDEIKREDYKNPRRQDLYGTSVISIQFSKGFSNTLSIKNRYNHSVPNPDATYGNSLENIIPGLTDAFEREYNLIIYSCADGFEIPGYVRAKDERYYKYNYEIGNIYYCINNIIIDNFCVIKDYKEKEKYLIIDCFILDLVNKKIMLFDETLNDSFVDCNQNIDNIIITNEENGKKIDLYFKDGTSAIIYLDSFNRIKSYINNNVKKIGNLFLACSEKLESLVLPNVERIGNFFLSFNIDLRSIDIHNVTYIGDDFLTDNICLESISLPNVKHIGDNFLMDNMVLRKMLIPNVEEIGKFFLAENILLQKLEIPNEKKIGMFFLHKNKHVSVTFNQNEMDGRKL